MLEKLSDVRRAMLRIDDTNKKLHFFDTGSLRCSLKVSHLCSSNNKSLHSSLNKIPIRGVTGPSSNVEAILEARAPQREDVYASLCPCGG